MECTVLPTECESLGRPRRPSGRISGGCLAAVLLLASEHTFAAVFKDVCSSIPSLMPHAVWQLGERWEPFFVAELLLSDGALSVEIKRLDRNSGIGTLARQ